MTRRLDIIAYLEKTPATIDDLAQYFEVKSATIVTDLEHIVKTLKHSEKKLLRVPPECLDCRYVFSPKRKRLNDPRRCPECRSEWLKPQLFKVE